MHDEEYNSEIGKFLQVARLNIGRGGEISLEDLERGMRDAALRDGSKALSELLLAIPDGEEVLCPRCGRLMHPEGRRAKQLVSLLGRGTVIRTYYSCGTPGCNTYRFPKDERLDISGTSFSPGVRRLMARSGSHEPFEAGRLDLREYSGIEVSAKDVERTSEGIGAAVIGMESAERPSLLAQAPTPAIAENIPLMYVQCDGTGVPMTNRELAGRRGKQEDGTAKTREAKLGCVFTQLSLNKDGLPVRDPGSTTYIGAIETAAEFGSRLEAEAIRRGRWQTRTVVFLGDGAKWVWALADHHFFGAVQIVDFYHASEHLHRLLDLLFPTPEELRGQVPIWRGWLENGEIEKIIGSGKLRARRSKMNRDRIAQEIGYFEENIGRMRYAEYRQKGYFVGSGVIEAGCKTIIGKRLKQSGMRWSLKGANSIIALRCCELSGRFDEFWEKRAAV